MSAYTNAHSAARGAYPPADGREWVVLLSPDTRRTMSTPEVQAEVRAGKLARETLVWRAGMSEWLAIAAVGELDVPPLQPHLEPAAAGWQPPAVQQRSAGHAHARPHAHPAASSAEASQELVMAAAVAAIMVATTLFLLSLGGAFAPGSAHHAANTSTPQQAH
jgi:hypothetical protein